jgi:hypothetical protein
MLLYSLYINRGKVVEEGSDYIFKVKCIKSSLNRLFIIVLLRLKDANI